MKRLRFIRNFLIHIDGTCIERLHTSDHGRPFETCQVYGAVSNL
jgi:hypothetical protein